MQICNRRNIAGCSSRQQQQRGNSHHAHHPPHYPRRSFGDTRKQRDALMSNMDKLRSNHGHVTENSYSINCPEHPALKTMAATSSGISIDSPWRAQPPPPIYNLPAHLPSRVAQRGYSLYLREALQSVHHHKQSSI